MPSVVPAIVYNDADYVRALQQLLPRGAAWPRDEGAVLTQLLTGLVGVVHDSNQDAVDLLAATFPQTATDFLTEWRATLAYDRIYGAGGSTSTQQGEVVATLTDSGGQSIAYFVDYAARLGYTITIEQLVIHNVLRGVSYPLAGPGFAFSFQVNVPTGTDTTRLAAMLDLFKPAHTTYFFNFT